jgi:hypothetical protein
MLGIIDIFSILIYAPYQKKKYMHENLLKLAKIKIKSNTFVLSCQQGVILSCNKHEVSYDNFVMQTLR